MKYTTYIILIVLFSLFNFFCSPYYVQIDYDRQADFSRYKTYKYIKKGKSTSTSKFTSELNKRRFAQAIDKELSKKGFERVKDTKEDFKVIYHLRFEKKLDISTYGYRYWPYYGISERYIQKKVYEEGSLIIDIIDKKENQLIWRGSVEGVLNERENAEELINTLVEKLLEDFPPKNK